MAVVPDLVCPGPRVGCMQVHMREMSPEGEEVIKTGKLYLVDLAGSENVNRQAQGNSHHAVQACAWGNGAMGWPMFQCSFEVLAISANVRAWGGRANWVAPRQCVVMTAAS